jgi:GAF domain-containing protein
MTYNQLKIKISSLVKESINTEKTLFKICEILRSKISYYDWVGFYFKNGSKQELKLGPYAGFDTDHKIIPFGKGICGQVALTNKNFVVPDVKKQNNYIACNINVKSEIVIPIFVDGKNIGQIDIDSNILNPFSKQDEEFLEYICAKVATLL